MDEECGNRRRYGPNRDRERIELQPVTRIDVGRDQQNRTDRDETILTKKGADRIGGGGVRFNRLR